MYNQSPMKLFTPGPVHMRQNVLDIGGKQLQYFRTDEFCKLNIENENLLKKFVGTTGRVVTLTSSGTGAMDAVLTNIIVPNNLKTLVISGGRFGERWIDLCKHYKVDHNVISVALGENVDLNEVERKIMGCDIILVQGTETSTGQKHPISSIGTLSKKYNKILVVDAITSFMCDEYSMDEMGVDITVLSSQKGLCIPPGLAFLAINTSIVKWLETSNQSMSFYFDLSIALSDGERGHTTWSPNAVAIMQLNNQLHYINSVGVSTIINNVKCIANDFRTKIDKLNIATLLAKNPSNSISAFNIRPEYHDINARKLFEYLCKNGIYTSPAGGSIDSTVFKIAHLGELTKEDNSYLIEILAKYFNKR